MGSVAGAVRAGVGFHGTPEPCQLRAVAPHQGSRTCDVAKWLMCPACRPLSERIPSFPGTGNRSRACKKHHERAETSTAAPPVSSPPLNDPLRLRGARSGRARHQLVRQSDQLREPGSGGSSRLGVKSTKRARSGGYVREGGAAGAAEVGGTWVRGIIAEGGR
ncbi:Hypothetical protein AA314_01654 [Archangium gephyra]|uniref:Uncharacterized protein n=1 Tax=Archangium gephyra TaxID=48 RepID=A0AAC8TBS8_9BACT|nr:Hypothetical protein AA314_01654 [Archangium gephyra]